MCVHSLTGSHTLKAYAMGFAGLRMPEPPPRVFRANRPFLALILADGARAYISIATAFSRDTTCLFLATCRTPQPAPAKIELSSPYQTPLTMPENHNFNFKLPFSDNIKFSPDMFK